MTTNRDTLTRLASPLPKVRYQMSDPDKIGAHPSDRVFAASQSSPTASPVPASIPCASMALRAARLWALLDDIDTLVDAARSDDAAFRLHVRNIQRRRFAILSGEQVDAIRREFDL